MGEVLKSFQDTQFSGDGSPEGVVKAPIGAEYRNLTGGAIWKKTTASHLATGWTLGTVTVSQISDATTFGKAVLAITGAADKVLSTSGASAPQLSDPAVTIAQITDATVTGKNLLAIATPGADSGLSISNAGVVNVISGATGTPTHSTGGIVDTAA